MQYMTNDALQYLKLNKGKKTVKQISEDLNLPFSLIRDYSKAIFRDPNLEVNDTGIKRNEKNLWLKEYLSKNIDLKHWDEMVSETDIPMTTLIYYANKFGLRKSAHLNETYFSDINSERQAYWLGFIMADGFIWERLHKLVIDLSAKDSNLLEAFRKDLCCDNQIKFFDQKDKRTNKTYKKAIFSVTSQILYNDLLSHGCTPRKSLTLQFPYHLPDDCIRHWIRGYFDGDGHLGKYLYKGRNKAEYKFGVVGTEHTLVGIKKYMNLNCRVCKQGKIYALCTGGANLVAQIGKYLYDDATVFLKRKRDILNDILGETALGH